MRQASRKTSTGTTVPRLERDAQPGISARCLVLMNKQVRKSLTFNDEHVSRRADVLWGRLSLFFSGSGQKPAASCRVVAFQTTLSGITSVFQAPRHTTQALREPSCRRQGLLKRARPARRSTSTRWSRSYGRSSRRRGRRSERPGAALDAVPGPAHASPWRSYAVVTAVELTKLLRNRV